MYTKIKYLLVFYTLLLSGMIYSQNSDEIMKKVISTFTDAKPLKFSLQYNLYKNYTTNSIFETYIGSFIKNSQHEVLMKVGPTDLLNTKQYTLQVDHKNKAILVNTPLKTATNLTKELQAVMKLCDQKSFKDFQTHWTIEYVPRQFTGLYYTKIVLVISKNYNIQKQIFYYSNPQNFSGDYRKNQSDLPRLEMIYTNYNRQIDNSLINPNLYIAVSNDDVITAHSKYKGYKVIDSRRKTKSKK